jgi:hypothetical protein
LVFDNCRGAAQGEGLGNAFLSHISAVDGIFHVCRAFEDPDVTHVEDRIDPVGDLEIIHSELRLKDIERLTGEKVYSKLVFAFALWGSWGLGQPLGAPPGVGQRSIQRFAAAYQRDCLLSYRVLCSIVHALVYMHSCYRACLHCCGLHHFACLAMFCCFPAAIHEGIKRQRGQVTKEMKEEMDCAEKVRQAAASLPQSRQLHCYCSLRPAVASHCCSRCCHCFAALRA